MKKHCFQRRGEVATFLVLASLAVVSLGTLLGSLAQQKFFTTKSTAQSTNNTTTSIKPIVASPFPAGPMQQGNGTVQVTPWAGACEVQVLVKYGQPNFWLKFDGGNGNSTTAYLGTVAYSGRNAVIRWNPKSPSASGGTPMDPNEIQVIKYVPGYTLDRYQKPAWLGYGPTNVTIYHVDDTQNPNATVYYTTVQADGCLTSSGTVPTAAVTPTPTLSQYEWSLMSDPADVCNIRVCENGPRPVDPLRYFTVESNGTQIFKTANQSVLDKPISGGGNIQCWNYPGRLLTYSKLQPYVGQNVTVAMRSTPTGNTEGFVNVKKDFKVDYSCFPNVPTPTVPPRAHYQLDLFKFIGSGNWISETSSPNCWGVWSNNCSNIPPRVETHQEVASTGDACSTSSVITTTNQKLVYTNSKSFCETVRCDYHECNNTCSAVDPTGSHTEDYICIKQPATHTDQKDVPPGCTATCTPQGVQLTGAGCSQTCPLPTSTPQPTPTSKPSGETYQIDLTFTEPYRAPAGLPDTKWGSYSSWGNNCPAPSPMVNLTTPQNGYLFSEGTAVGQAVFTNKTDYCIPMDCTTAKCGLTTEGKCQTARDGNNAMTNYAACSGNNGTPNSDVQDTRYPSQVVPPGCTATCTMNGMKVSCPNGQPAVCPATKTYQLDWAEHPAGQSFNDDKGFCWASWADSCPGIVPNNTTGMMPVPGTTTPLVYSCAGTTSANDRKPLTENKVVYNPTQDKQLNCVFFTCDACIKVRGTDIPTSMQDLAQCNTGLRKDTVVTVPAGCTGVCTSAGVSITGSDPKCAIAAGKASTYTTTYSHGKVVSTVKGKASTAGRVPTAKGTSFSATSAEKPKLSFLGCARTGFRDLAACDANGDGKVNAYDFQMLLTQ